MSRSLTERMRETIGEHNAAKYADGVIDAEEALKSLATCMAYFIASLPADRRVKTMVVIEDAITRTIADIVRDGHPIVGACFSVDRPAASGGRP